MIIANSSATLDTVNFDIWTGPDGTGDKLATYDAGDIPTPILASISRPAYTGTVEKSKTTLHLLVSTPQGAAASADVFLFGWDLEA